MGTWTAGVPHIGMVSLWLRRASPCLARLLASPLCHALSDNCELVPPTLSSSSFFLSYCLGPRAPKTAIIRVPRRAVEMTEMDSIQGLSRLRPGRSLPQLPEGRSDFLPRDQQGVLGRQPPGEREA